MTAPAARRSRPSRSTVRWHRPRALLAVAATVVGLTALGGVAAGVAVAGPTAAASGEFVPTAPARLVNSAAGKGWTGRLAPNATKTVTVSGRAGVPATNVLAVMLHVTTSGPTKTRATRNGNLWTWPAGARRPPYALVANAPNGAVADNTAVIRLGAGGQVSFYNGANGTAVDVIVDVEGYVTDNAAIAAGATFAAVQPSRILDTQDGTGGRSTPLRSGGRFDFTPLGVGAIPKTNVAAVALNLGAQATGTRANCWVQVQPTGTPTANASYPRVDAYGAYASQQLAVVAPDPGSGSLTFSTDCPSVDVFADVEGYYLDSPDGSSGAVYVPITSPTRVIDTRKNLGITGKLTANRKVTGKAAVPVVGVAGVPARATAVALNVSTVNGTAAGANTIWTDGRARPATGTVNVDAKLPESTLAFIGTGRNGKVDVAAGPNESNDLLADIEGYFYHSGSTDPTFATPQYLPGMNGDTYYNTQGTDGSTIITANDTRGVDHDCISNNPRIYGSDVGIFDVTGDDPAGNLAVSTVNCMRSFGRLADPNQKDGCTWKSGGITRVGNSLYLAVARQIKACDAHQTNGLQPSYDASIMRSDDDGRTWRNPWDTTASADGDAPPWSDTLQRYRAMFPGQTFSAPFFIQYGPGDTQTHDKGGQYLYAVSTDGYTYNGNYLILGRVPRDRIQDSTAWQYYIGAVGGYGQQWSSSPAHATHILAARNRLSQPAIQWVPALGEYVMTTFYFAEPHTKFPAASVNPYTRWEIYTSPKPWGPWTRAYDHSSQRNLWCTSDPCHLEVQPGSTITDVGTPQQWTGYYDLSLVQKFVYSQPLSKQMLFVNGDWMNTRRFPGEVLYSLHGLPFDLSALPTFSPP